MKGRNERLSEAVFRKLLLSGVQEEYEAGFLHRLSILNAILLMASLVLAIFIGLDRFYQFPHEYLRIAVAGLGLLVGTYLYLRFSLNVGVAAAVATLTLASMIIAGIHYGRGNDFTMGWTLLFPIAMIFIHGRVRGLLLSLLYFAIVFTMAYKGIGVWDYGHWNLHAFVRFVLINLAVTAAIYLFELSIQEVDAIQRRHKARQSSYIQRLEQDVLTDPLTRLPNRRYLHERFDALFRKAKRSGSLLCFFIMDIDHFKRYNDTYGHEAGDRALRRVSEVLADVVFKRESDVFCRLGGEEFGGFLIADDLHKIVRTLELARRTIEELGIEHEGNEPGVVTASFGACVIGDFHRKRFPAMYKAADTALYEAKSKGRNRVEGADRVVKI